MFLRYTLFCAAGAGVTSIAALAALARREGRESWAPADATSHWLHGEAAARPRQPDFAHTGVGLATHMASAAFWAVPFAAWHAGGPRRGFWELLRNGSVMAALAGVVDYGIVPRRLSPGWELVLPPRSVAGGFGALALGLALGGLLAQGRR